MNLQIITELNIATIVNALENNIDNIDNFNNDYELTVYNSFLSYFKYLPTIDFNSVVIVSSYICGTIPKNFVINSRGFPFVEKILNEKVRNFQELSDEDYLILVKCMNNSIISTSKLLHLIQPNEYPIINSRIIHYFKSDDILNTVFKKTKSKEKEIQQYKLYREICSNIINHKRFKNKLYFQVLNKMNQKNNYSKYKILEQIFQNSKE